jgi:hypothetical protein
MITDLNSSVSTISSEALDQLFAETPDNQVNADTLKVPSSEPFTVKQPSDINIPDIDLDKLDEPVVTEEKVEEDDDKKDEKVEKKDDKASDKKDDKKEDDKKDEPTDDEIKARNEFLKNSVDFLVQKGLFKDFEGREDIEMTEEVFSQLLEKQVEKQIEERYEAKKKSAGEYGEAILEYLDNGGEPDKVIDLFKEKKAIDDLSLDDDITQSELISKWYKEVHGWKPEKIKKYLDTLNAEEGSLEAEAEEIKTKYQDTYKKQIEQLQQEQQDYNKKQIDKQKAFETNISKVIETNKDFDLKRKKFIKDSIFKFKTLEDGTKVNDFYLKFAEWQNNPEAYIELAEFILDKEGYLKRQAVDIENKVVDKTFNFIKGNTAISKNKGSKHIDKDSTQSTGTDFSVVFK